MSRGNSKPTVSALAYRLMRQAIAHDPDSNSARAAIAQWFHHCERELERANEILRQRSDQNRKESL